MENITINLEENKRFCLYCSTFHTQLARHLKRKHGENSIIKEALNGGDWRNFCTLQGRKGNFYYNCSVLETGGELLLARKPSKEQNEIKAEDYGPCAFCLGFFKISCLKRHFKNCREAKKSELNDRQKIMSTYCLLPNAHCVSQEYLKNVIAKINADLRDVILKDEIILELGQRLYTKCNNTQEIYIREMLRKLAQTLLCVRNEKNDRKLSMIDLINVDYFYDLVNAALKLSGFGPERNFLESPSVALKIGFALNKVVEVVRSKSLYNRDMTKELEAERFSKLMKSDWSVYVCSVAYDAIKTNKLNKQELYPDEEDVKKLLTFLEEKINVMISDDFEVKYSDLLNVTLSSLVTYNFRRCSEISKMEINQFKKGIENDDNLDYLVEEEELEPAVDVKVVKIRCKKEIAIILKPEIVRAMQLLLKLREDEKDISRDNPYVFATAGDTHSRKQGCDAVKDVVIEADPQVGFRNKNLLNLTNLRKYFAVFANYEL